MNARRQSISWLHECRAAMTEALSWLVVGRSMRTILRAIDAMFVSVRARSVMRLLSLRAAVYTA